ncbi:TolC family outer membrane protein [Aeromonas cavernicola]|uniref:Channel protein TolC n=1 Tax=Aeromonas cavernicola TaxID=1006623 RepID=A0A2H9U5P5_9GAMM|nr:TolC family outer membrane protein [Aeromonas cavernicola]PJG59341.1 channel protein TolC [Aeromonas cavernicola]
MKKTIVAMLVSGTTLLSVPSQALTLEESVAQTLATHPKIKEAFSLYLARVYQHEGAKGGYYPTLDLRGGVGYEKTDSPSIRNNRVSVDDSMTRKEAGLSLRQMLFDGFDVSNNVSRTKAEANAQRLAMLSEAENTALRVAEVYLNMLRQQEILELSKQNLETHEQIRSDINKRTDSGLGSTADQTQIEGRVARAYANQAAAENNYLDAESEYIRVINETPKDLVQPTPVSDLVPGNLADALKKATEVHPTLLSSLQDIEAAKYQYEGAKSGFYPNVTFEVDQNWNEDIDAVEGRNDDLTAMIRMRYNLFRGGSDVAESNTTSALYNQSKDVHLNAFRQVEEGTRLAWNAKESLAKQKVFLKEHVDASYDTVQAYKKQFGLGERTLLDVLNTENELFEARRSYIIAEYDSLLADYRILNATGNLLNAFSVKQPEEWQAKVQ